MPLWRYVKTGMPFSPDEVAQMGVARSAIDELGIGEDEEMKREAVAQFIIDLARADGRADDASRMHKAARHEGRVFPTLGVARPPTRSLLKKAVTLFG
jgi:hypothetical protein